MLSARAIPVKQQTLIGFGVTVFGLLAAYEIAGWVAGENLIRIAFLAVGAGVCIVALRIMRDWRSGFYVFLAWVLFEDLIRKFLGNNMAIYFGKDALALLIYIALFIAVRNHRDRVFRPPFLFALAFFFWFAFLQVFNPNSPSALYGALGMKVYFWYVPLVFVGYALIRNDDDLRRFLTVSMVLAAVIAGLGIIQAIVGPQFLNPATLAPDIRDLGALDKVTPLTHEIIHLPSSVFVSTGRYSLYLFLASVVGMGSAGYLLLHTVRGRWIVFGSLGVIAVGIALAGSRGALVLSVASASVMTVAFIWGAPWRTRQVYRMLKAVRRSAIIMGLCLAAAAIVFPKAIGSRWDFYSETLSPSSSAYELSTRTWDYPLYNIGLAFSERHWVMGYGVGTTSLGAQYVARYLNQRRPEIAVESGYGSLVVELGIGGLILWLIWTTVLVIGCWRVVLKLRQTRLFPIGFAVFWFALVLLFPMTFGSINCYQDYILNAYLWILVGVLFRLPDLLLARPVPLPAPAFALRPNEAPTI
ncbi:MAG: hypothetical protein WA755_11670 [Candidatus Acidiferrales bacterium]